MERITKGLEKERGKGKDGNSKDSKFNLCGQYANRCNLSTSFISLWSHGDTNPATIQNRYPVCKNIWNPQDWEVNNQFLGHTQFTSPEEISRECGALLSGCLYQLSSHFWRIGGYSLVKLPNSSIGSEYFLKAIWLNLKINWNLRMGVWSLSGDS